MIHGRPNYLPRVIACALGGLGLLHATDVPPVGAPNPQSDERSYEYTGPFNVNGLVLNPTGTLTVQSGGTADASVTLKSGTVLSNGSRAWIQAAQTAVTLSANTTISPTTLTYEGTLLSVPTPGTGVRTIYMWGTHRFASLVLGDKVQILVQDPANPMATATLDLTVDGDVVIPQLSSILANNGYAPNVSVPGIIDTPSMSAGAHGCSAGQAGANQPYGNFAHPRLPGAAGHGTYDYGGGAIYLKAGRLYFSGMISVCATNNWGALQYGGAGGSLEIIAGIFRCQSSGVKGNIQVKGSVGTVQVPAPNGGMMTSAGTGGRIAIDTDKLDNSNSPNIDLLGMTIQDTGGLYLFTRNTMTYPSYNVQDIYRPVQLFYGPYVASPQTQPICPELFFPGSYTTIALAGDPWVFDADRDGLYTWEELSNGTDPYKADTNGDGIPDGQEIKMGLSGTNQDMDGDGLTNAEELKRGTNPFKADTDGDGVNDALDIAPLDRTRSTLTNTPGDTTPPVITFDAPTVTIIN